MEGWKLILAWIACVALGALGGYVLGRILWELGFELIGSAIAIAGAGLGGILMFFWFMNWSEDRRP